MNIYFSGIGGVGIGPLAEIALDAGYDVVGSDPVESLMTAQLQKRGVKIGTLQDGSFLEKCHTEKPIDWFVHTSALKNDHPELVLAKKLGIKTAKRDEILALIIKDKGLKLIAIAGTHGKTTTTSMFVWAMLKLNIPVSYSIGTLVSFGPSGKIDPDSEYFVYECDEFDRNFLHFTPYLSLIASVDYDHPDSYPTPAEYVEAFQQFVGLSREVIGWNDQHPEIYTGHPASTLLDPRDVRQFKLPGDKNRRNATLVYEGLKRLGINQNLDDAINSYPGSSRRFEKLADNLYTDYGHNPAEVTAILQLASELSDHVLLVYQPHQNVRQTRIRDQYVNTFEKAELVYWMPTYLSREDPNLPILKPEDLIANVINKEKIEIVELNDELWDKIQKARGKGMLVVCVNAGSLDKWLRDKLAGTN